jgi:hypothetical protein
MKRFFILMLAIAAPGGLLVPTTASAQKHELVYARDGSGVFGYKDTPMQPWSGFHVHDPDRPAPPKVVPPQLIAESASPTAPSDAIVLFDGRDLSAWQPSTWRIDKGELVATDGPLASKEEFGDCQLHLEWMAPKEQTENVMNRGNNGVFLLGAIEVQIFDSFTTRLYPDGQAAAIYAQTPPLVNACREPGQWQSYDIVFVTPKYQNDKLETPARLTMLHNGVLVHLHQVIYGLTPHARLAEYPQQPLTKGPLSLGAHHCPVRFRNIWIRRL